MTAGLFCRAKVALLCACLGFGAYAFARDADSIRILHRVAPHYPVSLSDQGLDATAVYHLHVDFNCKIAEIERLAFATDLAVSSSVLSPRTSGQVASVIDASTRGAMEPWSLECGSHVRLPAKLFQVFGYRVPNKSTRQQYRATEEVIGLPALLGLVQQPFNTLAPIDPRGGTCGKPIGFAFLQPDRANMVFDSGLDPVLKAWLESLIPRAVVRVDVLGHSFKLNIPCSPFSIKV